MKDVNARDAISAMRGRGVEQVNFSVAVQSQETSRMANLPYPSVGRLAPSSTRDESRQGDGDSFEIDASGLVSCTLQYGVQRLSATEF